MNAKLLGLIATFGLAAVGRPTRADWPSARHDARRTAAAAGTSNLSSPVSYWRYYLGGTVEDAGVLTTDVDGDGVGEVIFATGGRITARKLDGTTIWQTPARGFVSLVGAADLDGNGVADLLARTASQVVVLSAQTGTVAWAQPADALGTLGGVRVADFTADGKPDLLTQECGCCAVNNQATGYAYSFGAGLTSPKKLWALPTIACGGANSTTLFQDASGKLRLLYGDYTSLHVLDLATGAKLATASGLWHGVQLSRCLPSNVDGQPGDELVCTLSTTVGGAGAGHKAFLAKFDATASKLSIGWSADVGALDSRVISGPGMVSDLDGDGLSEVTVGGEALDQTPSTYILDANDGKALATIPGERSVGTQRLGPAPGADAITSSPGGLVGWTFSRTPSPTISMRWSLAGFRAQMTYDPTLATRGAFSQRFILPDLNGDSVPDLVVTPDSLRDLVAFALGGSTPVELAKYSAPADTELLRAWVLPIGGSAAPNIATARTDGKLVVFGSGLTPTGPEIMFGGYYASGAWGQLDRTHVIASLATGKPQSVLIPNSRGTLVRLDTSKSGLAEQPKPAWSRTHTFAPVVVGAGPNVFIGARALAEPLTDPPKHEIRALNTDGTIAWSKPVLGTAFNDVIAANLDGDSVADLVIQWGADSDTALNTRAFSGKDGSVLWSALPSNPGPTRAPAGLAAADWDGDGRDEVVFQHYGTHVLRASDGTKLAGGGPTAEYFMPILADLNGDGAKDVVYQGGYHASQAWLHDLKTPFWTGDPNDRPFPYAAFVGCPGGTSVVVEGSSAVGPQLRLTTAAGTSAGGSEVMYLAGGKHFTSLAAAQQSGAWLGQLTSAVAHQNLTGAGHPTAVVGSNDGWLYAVNVCDATLDFTINFGWPVGATAFGDTDGDGNDDLVVSVADGYLYNLRQAPVSAPSYIWDIDPDHGELDSDVDEVETLGKLSARWGQVTNATSYELAVVRQSTGDLISDWTDVGSVKTATIDGLALNDGEVYQVAVRSMKGTLRSPDALSDGVTVHFAGSADAGTDAPTDSPTAPPHDGSLDGGPGAGEILSGRACTCGSVRAGDWGDTVGPLASLIALVGWGRRSARRRGATASPLGSRSAQARGQALRGQRPPEKTCSPR